MPKYAVIDIGSNSILLLIAELTASCEIKIIKEEFGTGRLSKDLNKTGFISNESLNKSLGIIGSQIEIAKKENVDDIFLVGTQALRIARNRKEIMERIEKKFGYQVDVVDQEKEASLSFKAAIWDKKDKDFLVIDIGGASTEISLGTKEKNNKIFKFDIGCVLANEKLKKDPPEKNEIQKLVQEISEKFINLKKLRGELVPIGVGGTITTLVSIFKQQTDYNREKIHGVKLTKETINSILNNFISLPLEQRKKIPGLPEDRADIIIGGTLILQKFLDVLGCSQIQVSVYGLRFGYFLDKIPQYHA